MFEVSIHLCQLLTAWSANIFQNITVLSHERQSTSPVIPNNIFGHNIYRVKDVVDLKMYAQRLCMPHTVT